MENEDDVEEETLQYKNTQTFFNFLEVEEKELTVLNPE